MPDYRRHRLPGGCYFFTVNALERRTDLLTRHIEARRMADGKTRYGTASAENDNTESLVPW